MIQEAQNEAVALAREALRRELGSEGDDIERIDLAELVRAEPVDWPDGSLGCPRKGMAYTQAIVPGWRLTLSFRGWSWQVHTGGRQAVICRRPTELDRRE
jgi:hypothetical protein